MYGILYSFTSSLVTANEKQD